MKSHINHITSVEAEVIKRSLVDWTKLTFEQRMELRAQRRQTPEYLERIAAIKRRRRFREIWQAIRESEGTAPTVRRSPVFSRKSHKSHKYQN
jgi:hypothetical protein